MTTPSSPAPESKKWLRSFGPIWAGQAFSLLGSGLVQFSLVWWLTDKTGSTAVLATATLVAMLPQVFLGPFAGALIDRWNRRWVMVVADSVIALVTLALVALFLSGLIQIWHVFTAMFLRSLGGAFHWPSMQASTALMVPQKHLSRLAGANQALNGMINIAAPPLGALLLAILPIHQVLAIDIITAMLAVLPLLFIRIPQPAQSDGEQALTAGKVLRDVRAGLRYVVAWPGLFGLLLMATLINFFLNPGFTFIPLLVTRHFEGGAMQLGWLQSAFGVGVVTGGLILSAWGGFRRRILTSLLGLLGMGLGVSLIGIAPPWGYWLAWGGMLLAGIMSPLVNGPIFALLQAKVEPHMHGRVFTLVNSLAGAMMPLSMIIAAPVAEWLGLRTWYFLGGGVCMLMGLVSLFVRSILTIDDQQPGGKILIAKSQPVPLVSD